MRHIRTYKILYLVSIWMIYWLAVSGATIYVLPVYLNADQWNNSWITCIHFATFAVVSALFFRVQDSLPHLEKTRQQVVAVLLTAILFILLTWLYDSFNGLSDTARDTIMMSKLYYPLFTFRTTIPKVFDIIFQQITIFGFIKYLLSKGLEKKKTMVIIWLALAFMHIPLILGATVHGVTLVIPGLFAGLLFGYLILNFRYGVALSFAAHFGFYFVMGMALRAFY